MKRRGRTPVVSVHNVTRRHPARLTTLVRAHLSQLRRQFATLRGRIIDEFTSGEFAVNEFNPAQPRDDTGKWAAGVGAVKAVLKRATDLSPSWLKVTGGLAAKASMALIIAGNKAVTAVAKERGLTDAQVARVSKVVACVDVAMGGWRGAGAATALGLGALAVPAAVVPLGSLSYLAYSTARNPMATYRAARKAVMGVVGAARELASLVVPGQQPLYNSGTSLTDDETRLVATTVIDHDYDAWYEALLFAALDRHRDVRAAVAVARRAAHDPTLSSSERHGGRAVANYDPEQPREPTGRWIKGATGHEHSSGYTLRPVKDEHGARWAIHAPDGSHLRTVKKLDVAKGLAEDAASGSGATLFSSEKGRDAPGHGAAVRASILREIAGADRHLGVDLRDLHGRLEREHGPMPVEDMHRHVLDLRSEGKLSTEQVTRHESGLLHSLFTIKVGMPDKWGQHNDQIGYVRSVRNTYDPDQPRDAAGRWAHDPVTDVDRSWSDRQSFVEVLRSDPSSVKEGINVVEPYVYMVKDGKAEIQMHLDAVHDSKSNSYHILHREMPPERIEDRVYTHGTEADVPSISHINPGKGYGKWGANEYDAVYVAQKGTADTREWGSRVYEGKLPAGAKIAKSAAEVRAAWDKHPEMGKQAALEAEGYHGVAKLDARGDVWEMAVFRGGLVMNWAASTSPERLNEFQRWLSTQIDSTLIGKSKEQMWTQYIHRGWQQGAGRAFDDTNKARPKITPEDQVFYQGGRQQFLRDAFNQPVARERVDLLASRTFDEMEDVSRDVANRMSRALVDGLIGGSSSQEITSTLVEATEFGRGRAEKVARTEIMRAHAEGQLDGFQQMGVQELGVLAELSTSGLGNVCEECAALAGETYTIEEARGLIPVHPQCECVWIPNTEGA